MNVIKSPIYGETVKKLKSDPIIVAMTERLVTGLGLDGALDFAGGPADDDSPSWEFTQRALDGYRYAGGYHAGHIGGPAEAIRSLLLDRRGAGQ